MPTLRQKVESSTIEAEHVLLRILEATHSHTSQDLADFFDTSLSSARKAIASIQKGGAVPDSWFVALMCMQNVHPEWVLTGNGPRWIYRNPEGHYESHEAFTARQDEREILQHLSTDALLYEIRRRTVNAMMA
ncbi:MAG: hypothetical protein R3Y11_08420 [Pseudomonadota bacterium]